MKKNDSNDVIDNTFIFNPENLLNNLERLGAWSSYGLASYALQYYFPEEYNEDVYTSTQREVELLEKLGCEYWQDVIRKYHNEVGYTVNNLCDTEYVNAY